MNLIKISAAGDDSELCELKRDAATPTYEERSNSYNPYSYTAIYHAKSRKENRIDIYKLRLLARTVYLTQ